MFSFISCLGRDSVPVHGTEKQLRQPWWTKATRSRSWAIYPNSHFTGSNRRSFRSVCYALTTSWGSITPVLQNPSKQLVSALRQPQRKRPPAEPWARDCVCLFRPKAGTLSDSHSTGTCRCWECGHHRIPGLLASFSEFQVWTHSSVVSRQQDRRGGQ